MFYFQFVGSHRSPLLHFPFHLRLDRLAASAPDPPDSPLLQKSPSQQSIEQDVMLIVLRLQTIKEENVMKN